MTISKFASRKLLVTVFAVLVLLAGWITTHFVPSIAGNFQIFKDGLVAIIALYLTGNVAHHYVLTKPQPNNNGGDNA